MDLPEPINLKTEFENTFPNTHKQFEAHINDEIFNGIGITAKIEMIRLFYIIALSEMNEAYSAQLQEQAADIAETTLQSEWDKQSKEENPSAKMLNNIDHVLSKRTVWIDDLTELATRLGYLHDEHHPSGSPHNDNSHIRHEAA